MSKSNNNKQLLDSLGFVSINEIAAVFAMFYTKLDQDIMINGVPKNPRLIFEFYDDLRLELFARAKFNIEDFILKNPETRKRLREITKIDSDNSKKKDYRDRIKENRERAMLGHS